MHSIGHDSSTLQRDMALLIGTLLLPVVLALWLRRRALNAEVADKAPVSFSYMRYQQWLLNGSLLTWWACVESVHLSAFLTFFLAPTFSRMNWLLAIIVALANWIPPAIIWVICVTISQPVQQKLRGLTWTRKELALQATYALCSALLPLILTIRGIVAGTRGDFRMLIVCIVAAFFVKLIAAGRLVKLLGMQSQALTTGELRDTAFNVAQRLGVKLQQIYVIPAGKIQTANAFARKGNTIAFTDYLLQRMTRREINYVLAHELNHLRLKHLKKLSTAFVGSLTVAIFLMIAFRSSLPDSTVLRYGLIFVILTLGQYFWSRRFEFEADAGAVQTTGDAEAAISALFKLSTLNMHPLQWSKWTEKWLTHPSTQRRAQAIAKKAGIPLSHVAAIAETAVKNDAHYPIPASAIAGNKLHSSSNKASDVRRLGLTFLAVRLLVPTAFALVVKFVAMSPSADRFVYLLGAMVTLATHLVLINFLAARRIGSLIPLLKAKLLSEGIDVDAWRGVPVALAPAALPRVYEGHSHWDLGFLFFGPDRISYWGEETRFSLRRGQITDMKIGPGGPALIRLPRIYIAWRHIERPACGVFSLASAEPGTLLALRRRTKDLLVHMLQWRKESFAADAVPARLASLTAPAFGDVTGTSPLAWRKSQAFVREMYRTALFAAALAIVAGLPFHATTFLTDPEAFASRPHVPGSGWYVVVVAAAIRILQYVPIFLYKEKPVVQASLAPAPASKSATAAAVEQKVEPEPAIR